MSILQQEGFHAILSENNLIMATEKSATDHPENINRLLVQSGNVPSMLNVEEEELEEYFLRIIKERSNQPI